MTWTILRFHAVMILWIVIRGYHSECISEPVYVWPLGEQIETLELKLNSSEGTHYNIEFADGPVCLDYQAMQFEMDSQSYAQFPVKYTDLLTVGQDYSLRFYINPSSTGTLFHYVCDNFGATLPVPYIQSLKLAFNGSDIIFTLSDSISYIEQISPVTLSLDTWHCLSIVRSSKKFKIYLNDTLTSPTVDFSASWLDYAIIKFPGIMRIGGTQENTDFLSGGITCMQLIPCKLTDSGSHFDYNCLTSNWTDLLSSTKAVSTPTSAQTTSTMTSASTSESTTKPSQMAHTSPIHETTPSPVYVMTPSMLQQSYSNDRCTHYTVHSRNAFYKNKDDILNSYSAKSVLSCSWHCNNDPDCKSFVVHLGYCWIASGDNPVTVFQDGAVLYILSEDF